MRLQHRYATLCVRLRPLAWLLLFSIPLTVAPAAPSLAQNFNAGSMWGVSSPSASSSGAPSASTSASSDSTTLHLSQSAIANYVTAAKAGVVLNPNLTSSLTIQSVGSQTIVSNTVSGNNNSTTFAGSQTSSNSGTVNNTANMAQ